MLKKQYEKVAVHGRNRTCYSLLYEAEPFYLAAVRDVYTRDLDEIVTDIPEIHEKIFAYLSEFQPDKLEILKLYQVNYFHYISFTVWRVRSMKYAMKRSG